MKPWHTTVFFACAMAPLAIAQTKSDGPFAGTAGTFSMDHATTAASGGTAGGDLHVKKYGYTTMPPQVWPAGTPDFSPNSLIFAPACLVGPGFRTLVNVDAFSIGVDQIFVDPASGTADMTPPQWDALHFSVTQGTSGAAGSRVADETAGSEGAAGDLFTYVVPGSARGWAMVVDIVYRALDSGEIALGGPVPDIDGYDFFLYEYQLPPNCRTAPLPLQPTFYFSVDNASLPFIHPTWWAGTSPSGATILQTSWTGLSWTCPQPFVTFAQLGLAQDEDIDAIAIDRDRAGATHTMILSTDTSIVPRNPLLAVDISAIAAPTLPVFVYTVEVDGVTGPVSSRLGLEGADDIDAVCLVDPATERMGMPQPPFPIPLPLTGTTNATAFGDCDAAGNRIVRTFISGDTCSPGGTVSALFLNIGPSGFFHVANWARPANGFLGNPWPLDPPPPMPPIFVIPNPPVLSGFVVDLWWISGEIQCGMVDSAPPVQIVL